jgi:hypothetical protein
MTPDPIEEAVARAICDAWGYDWDGDSEDEQTAPEIASDGDTRPDKALYREAARKAIAAYLGVLASMDKAYRNTAKRVPRGPQTLTADEIRHILTGGR